MNKIYSIEFWSDEKEREWFWANVQRSDEECCWPFIGKASPNQYGHLNIYRRGGAGYVHRIAFLLGSGPIGRQCVLHQCDNPKCCNHGHLFLGTRADNLRDMCAKGRHRPGAGERHGRAKLSDDQVRLIFQRQKAGASQRKIAREFKLTQNYVWGLLNGHHRKGVQH